MMYKIKNSSELRDFFDHNDIYFHASSNFITDVSMIARVEIGTDVVHEEEYDHKYAIKKVVFPVADYLEYPITFNLNHGMEHAYDKIPDFNAINFETWKLNFDNGLYSSVDNLIEIRDKCKLDGTIVARDVGFSDLNNALMEIEVRLIDILREKSLNFKTKKSNLKKQLETIENKVPKDKIIGQIRSLVNSNWAFFESNKVFELAYNEAKLKFNFKDHYWDHKVKLSQLYSRIRNVMIDLCSDLVKKLQVNDYYASEINVAPYALANPDMICTSDGYKRVGFLIDDQGRLDRARLNYYIYQSVVNIGDLYFKFDIDRDEELFEAVKVVIKSTADEFEVWLNDVIAKCNKSYNKKKSELKKQLERYSRITT